MAAQFRQQRGKALAVIRGNGHAVRVTLQKAREVVAAAVQLVGFVEDHQRRFAVGANFLQARPRRTEFGLRPADG